MITSYLENSVKMTNEEIFKGFFGFDPRIGLECVADEFWSREWHLLHNDTDAEAEVFTTIAEHILTSMSNGGDSVC